MGPDRVRWPVVLGTPTIVACGLPQAPFLCNERLTLLFSQPHLSYEGKNMEKNETRKIYTYMATTSHSICFSIRMFPISSYPEFFCTDLKTGAMLRTKKMLCNC
jgi:hypothetical protein